MVNSKALLVGIGLFLIAHIITWFQLNGQFFSEWFKNNTFIVALLGVPLSWLYIYGTKACYDGFGGLVWPGRFIGFACGMVVFSLLTSYIMNEGVTIKTGISLGLALTLVSVQIFWK